jgi:hypothetical protein
VDLFRASDTDQKNREQILNAVASAKERDTKDSCDLYDALSLRVLHKCAIRTEAENLCRKLYSSEQRKTSSYIADVLISTLREFFGDEIQARQVADEYLAVEDFDVDIFAKLFSLLLDLGEHSVAITLLESHKRRLTLRSEKNMYRNYFEKTKDFEKALSIHKEIENLTGKQDISRESYLLLLAKRATEARSLLQPFLESKNYSAEATSEIVNFELARKLSLGAKPDNGRLDEVLKFEPTSRTKAAVAALRGHKTEAITHIRDVMRTDKTFRYAAMEWPVFEELHTDENFKRLIHPS